MSVSRTDAIELIMEDLRGLQLLVRVAATGSFTEAARQRGLTTSAVSKIVSRLEGELGVRLFNRTTRQISLTQQGRLFVERAGVAMEQLAQAVDLLHAQRGEPVGPLRITSNASFGKEHILPLLPRFLDDYPRVDLELRLHDGRIDLVREGFDIGIDTHKGSEGTYVSRPLCELPLILVASPAYLARHGTPATVDDLAAHSCINVRLSDGQVGRWVFVAPAPKGRARGRAREQALLPTGRLLIAEQYDAVIPAALAGLGPTVVFAHSVLRHLRAGELKVLLPDHTVEAGSTDRNKLFVRYPHRQSLPLSARRFVDFLMQHFSDGDALSFDKHEYAAAPMPARR